MATTPPTPRLQAPRAFLPPPGSVDTHVHVFDPARFPFRADSPYQPVACEHGTAGDLAAVLDATGIDRVVLVNPTSGYGDDNRCMLDAIARLGARARGIARVPLDITARRLASLRNQGVVGVRVDFVAAGLAPLSDPALAKLLARLADLDLMLDVQAEGAQWTAIAPVLRAGPMRVVVDHLGRPDPASGLRSPAFRALLGLADTARVAVKLSGAMRASKRGPPHADMDPYFAALVGAYTPRALVWGSDWPFLRTGRRTDYAPFLAHFAKLVPDARSRRAIMSTTAARWFGFGPA